jgi:hypothetical protein
MQVMPFRTRFTVLTRWQALTILILTAAALAWCLIAALFPQSDPGSVGPGGSDLRLYRQIVERVHAGENYYDAAGSELRAQGYPTGSLFNWRPPVYAWVIGNLPTPAWGQALAVLLALTAMLLMHAAVQREGGPVRARAMVLLLLGPFLWCLDGDAFLSQELWAGILIALSMAAYGTGRWLLGFAAGLLALAFRELALPYVLLALALAWREGRRSEVALWVAGLGLYGAGLFLHGLEVSRHMSPGDRQPGSWIQFGGLPFLLTTCRMNEFLFPLPAWITALYLPLALLGLSAWRGPTAARTSLTVGAYLAAFVVVGQPFNNYWGLLYAPLLALGLVWTPAALRDLYHSLRAAPVTSSAPAPCLTIQ